MKVGDTVKVNDHSDWHGLYGVIDEIQGNMAFVYCVAHPDKLHPVLLENLQRCNL
jgi:hypothetical protein